MLLTYLDIEYEDIVYDNTTRQTTWMKEIKPNLGLDFPNLPYYIDGDLKLTQSLAIIRYLGKKNGPLLVCRRDFRETCVTRKRHK